MIKKIGLLTLFVVFGLNTKLFDFKQDDVTELAKLNSEVKSQRLTSYNPLREKTYVYTPNKSKVTVLLPDDREYFNVSASNEYYDTRYPLANRISISSNTYNCHSYAWYSQDLPNIYWMDDPTPYYTDGSYVEVSSPKIGDKICYFDDLGTEDTKDDINLHSGIITGYKTLETTLYGGADKYVVTSKWGSGGLYEHDALYCPYTSLYGGEADYIKYYSLPHEHSYKYVYKDRLTHTGTCECGDITSGMHVVAKGTIVNNRANCLECNHLLDLSKDMAEIKKLDAIKYSLNGSILLPNGIIILEECDIEDYYNGKLEFYSDLD